MAGASRSEHLVMISARWAQAPIVAKSRWTGCRPNRFNRYNPNGNIDLCLPGFMEWGTLVLHGTSYGVRFRSTFLPSMRPIMRTAPSRSVGFTLIDVVVAVLIVGITAAIIGPRFASSLNARQAESGARMVAADLNYLRKQAITRGKSVVVTFDNNSASYVSSDAASADCRQSTFSRSLIQWAGNVQIEATFDAEETIEFDLRGLPWVNNQRMTVGSVNVDSASFQWLVLIDPTTGIASVQNIPSPHP